MIFYTLDDYEDKVSLSRKRTKDNPSKLHLRSRIVLKKYFPTCSIYEELPIKIYRYQQGYLDFYIPLYNIIVEANGEQHFKFNHHFYSSKKSFLIAQRRDRDKREWAEYNNCILLDFNYNEKEKEWTNKLNKI